MRGGLDPLRLALLLFGLHFVTVLTDGLQIAFAINPSQRPAQGYVLSLADDVIDRCGDRDQPALTARLAKTKVALQHYLADSFPRGAVAARLAGFLDLAIKNLLRQLTIFRAPHYGRSRPPTYG